MLTPSNIKSSSNARNIIIYREQVQSGYYESCSSHTEWFGVGAKALGLNGPVDGQVFTDILNGDFGLINKQKHSNQQKGTDFTFSAPKGVSILALVANDTRVMDAHKKAVRAALSYFEENIITARFGKGGTQKVKTGNMIAGLYTHEDARPVDGVVAPQLHTHALIANATMTKDGNWKAVHFSTGPGRELLKLANAQYLNTLRLDLEKINYETFDTKDGFEIKGLEEAVTTFSLRSKQIEDHLSKSGKTRETATTSEKQQATLLTRQSKKNISQHEQRTIWNEMAEESGVANTIKTLKENSLDSGEVQHSPGTQSEVQQESTPIKLVDDMNPRTNIEHLKEDIDEVIKDLNERKVDFDEDSFFYRFNKHNRQKRFIGHEQAWVYAIKNGLVFKKDNDSYTSRMEILKEIYISETVNKSKNLFKPVMSIEKADEKIEEINSASEFKLTKGQSESIHLALTTKDQIIGVVGAAGSGKTTSMKPAADAFKEQGYRIVGLGPTGRASQELMALNADEVMTIASFNLRDGAIDEGDNRPRFLIVDEAGMISTDDMKKMIENMNPTDRVLLVGDHRQLQSVASGTPFEMLQSTGMNYATISKVIRQKEEAHRKTAELFAKGDADEAAERIMQNVAHVAVPNVAKGSEKEAKREAMADAIMSEYKKFKPEKRDGTAIITETNAQKETLNRRVREFEIEQGRIDTSQEQAIQVIEKASLTRIERYESKSYELGMIAVDFSEKTDEKGNRTQYKVTDIDHKNGTITLGKNLKYTLKELLDNDSLNFYREKTLELAKGDKIVFKERNNAWDVLNGDTAKVISVSERTGEITFSNGLTVDPFDEQMGSIEHAYAGNIYLWQGATKEFSLIAGENSLVASSSFGYVAATRHKANFIAFTTNVKRLREKWSEHAEDKSTLVKTELVKTDKNFYESFVRQSGQEFDDFYSNPNAHREMFNKNIIKVESPSENSHTKRADLNENLASSVLKAYQELSPREKEDTAIVVTTDNIKERATAKIRNHLVESGELSKDHVSHILYSDTKIKIPTLHNLKKTHALMDNDTGEVKEIDSVQRGQKRVLFKDGSFASEAEIAKLKVLDTRQVDFRVGDQIRFGKEGPDGSKDVSDIISGIDHESKKLTLSSGHSLDFSAIQKNEVEHNYVRQGGEAMPKNTRSFLIAGTSDQIIGQKTNFIQTDSGNLSSFKFFVDDERKLNDHFYSNYKDEVERRKTIKENTDSCEDIRGIVEKLKREKAEAKSESLKPDEKETGNSRTKEREMEL